MIFIQFRKTKRIIILKKLSTQKAYLKKHGNLCYNLLKQYIIFGVWS